MNWYFFFLMLNHNYVNKQKNICDHHSFYGWTKIFKFMIFKKTKMIDQSCNWKKMIITYVLLLVYMVMVLHQQKKYQFIMKYLQKILLMVFGFSSKWFNQVFKWIVKNPHSGYLKVKNQRWNTDWQQHANWERVKRDFYEKVIISPSV